MFTKDTSSLGEWLIAFGSVWFVLALIWPPFLIASSFFKLPESLVRLIWPLEFAISATMAAVGVLLRRRTTRRLSLADYIIALGGASISVLTVFHFYGWVHL